MIGLKILIICSLLLILWIINRKRQNKIRQEISDGFNTKMFANSNLVLAKSFIPDFNLDAGRLRIRTMIKNRKIISVVIYSLPSNLLDYRGDNDETDLIYYSHIFLIETDPEFRRQGLIKELLTKTFLDTRQLSAGITIKTDQKEIKELLIEKFEFKDSINNNLLKKYDNRSRLR